MPEGNAHQFPPGLWYQEPTTSSIPRLLLKSVGKVALLFAFLSCVEAYRSLARNYTYTNFIGRTMTFGTLSTDTHEPATTEEIDRLKAAEAERKKLKRAGLL